MIPFSITMKTVLLMRKSNRSLPFKRSLRNFDKELEEAKIYFYIYEDTKNIGTYKGGETMRVKVRSVWKYLIALVFKALERGRSELGGKTKRLHRFTSSLHLNLVWTPFKWISLH